MRFWPSLAGQRQALAGRDTGHCGRTSRGCSEASEVRAVWMDKDTCVDGAIAGCGVRQWSTIKSG